MRPTDIVDTQNLSQTTAFAVMKGLVDTARATNNTFCDSPIR
jgi:hypothetical protein